MNPFFSFFHSASEPLALTLPAGKKRGKRYEGADVINLPVAEPITVSFEQVLTKRESQPDFDSSEIDLQGLSTLLYWSVGQLGERDNLQNPGTKKPHRTHPSGGGLFPLEIYIAVGLMNDLSCGWYHYRPDLHVLETVRLISIEAMTTSKRRFAPEQLNAAPIHLCISMMAERVVPVYRTLAYQNVLLEAGHIGQNISLIASALDVACAPIGLAETETSTQLQLDQYNETVIYKFALGRINT
ncbi:MAG: SagB/ThcOx family dehydrogenase [Patescibacteria group bacterium]